MKNILAAFSNATRLKIVICLGNREKNVTELIGNCRLSQSAVSQHLAKLKAAGIISCRKVGREQLYSISNTRFVRIGKQLFSLLKIKD